MSGVAELLAAETDSAPVQRVRNYYLTDREAVPRAQDFLTAMKRTDGALCVRWAGPPGECFVRYADPGWERAEHDRFRGRTTVETVDGDRVRRWFRNSRPELIAYDDIRESFETDAPNSTTEGPRAAADRSPPRAATPVAADGVSAHFTRGGSPELRSDGGELSEAKRASSELASDGGESNTARRTLSELVSDGGEPGDDDLPIGQTLRVRQRGDLQGDPALSRGDAEAVAAALPAGADEIVFWLPLALAEEKVLAPTTRSDRVFVAEVVPERETDHAYYVRQGRRGGWIPKGEARVYELADCALGEGVEGRRESA